MLCSYGEAETTSEATGERERDKRTNERETGGKRRIWSLLQAKWEDNREGIKMSDEFDWVALSGRFAVATDA